MLHTVTRGRLLRRYAERCYAYRPQPPHGHDAFTVRPRRYGSARSASDRLDGPCRSR